MKLYKTTSQDAGDNPEHHTEFASSDSNASKARTRLKKANQLRIETTEVEITTTRDALIAFLNSLNAHESCVVAP
jgi:hypothetical protein